MSHGHRSRGGTNRHSIHISPFLGIEVSSLLFSSKAISFGFFGHFVSLVNPLLGLLDVPKGVPLDILLLEPGCFRDAYFDPPLAFFCVGA